MSVYTDRGQKIRLDTAFVFVLIGRLVPKYNAFAVFSTWKNRTLTRQGPNLRIFVSLRVVALLIYCLFFLAHQKALIPRQFTKNIQRFSTNSTLFVFNTMENF